MIAKILKIENVGLLQNGTPKGAVTLAPITVIYADNGRGKSTFAAILRACQLADVVRVIQRKTLDANGSPEIAFLLGNGNQVAFAANTWTGPRPRIEVFDSEFVYENVYSGSEIRADQRQSLLEFALGDQTVQLTQEVERLTQELEAQNRKRMLTEKALTGYASPYTVAEFIALPPVADAQELIEVRQKRIEAARSAPQLAARQEPYKLDLVGSDVFAAFDLLRKQLADIEASAEAVVESHLAKHRAPGVEDWISRGRFTNQDFWRL